MMINFVAVVVCCCQLYPINTAYVKGLKNIYEEKKGYGDIPTYHCFAKFQMTLARRKTLAQHIFCLV